MIELRRLFDLNADVAKPQLIANGPYGDRRFIPVQGGTFSGERLSGRVLSGGADCQLIRPDGVAELDVRVTLETNDGVIILMKGLGMRHGPEPLLTKMAKGEPVDSSQIYFRQSAVFEAPEGPYDWLNRLIAIASGERRAESVVIEFFEIR